MTEANLLQLLDGCGATGHDRSVGVSGIAYRSDTVRQGDAFFCIPGFRHDGHDFAADAVARGAAAVVCTRGQSLGVPESRGPGYARALAVASARFFGEPSRALDVVGITGTNGKTTTTYLLDSILRAAGRTTGLIGTVETRIAGRAAAVRAYHAGVRRPAGAARAHARRGRFRCVDGGLVSCDRPAPRRRRRTSPSRHSRTSRRTIWTTTTRSRSTATVKRRLFTEMRCGRTGREHRRFALGARLPARSSPCWTVGRDAHAMVRALTTCAECRPRRRSRWSLLSARRDVALPLAGAFNVCNALVAAAARSRSVCDARHRRRRPRAGAPGAGTPRAHRRGAAVLGARRLRPHAGQPREGDSRGPGGHPGTRDHRLRMRRRPRPRQAAADGRRGAAGSRRGGRDERQPAQRGPGRHHPADRGRHAPDGHGETLWRSTGVRLSRAALEHRTRRRRGADRGQGPRGLPDLRGPDGALRRSRSGARGVEYRLC